MNSAGQGAGPRVPGAVPEGELAAGADAVSVSGADSLARDRASDPQRSVLLQAPAGSGKTTVLTERLLRLLAVVEQPEEILAITFTRKAAGEMRARVLKALRGEGEKDSAQGRRLHQFAQLALARADARGWHLAEDAGRLRIQTIDSFNFRLASQLTVTAKAGGAMLITERPQELYDRAARQTLAAADDDPELAADVELLFDRLDNSWSNVQRLLADMLRQRGHWLRYVLGHEPGALCLRVGRSLTEIARDHLRAASSLLSPSLRAEAAALPRVGALTGDPDSLPAWKSLGGFTLTAKCEWRKPKGINKSLGPEYESNSVKDTLNAAIEHLSAVPGFREVLAELGTLPAAQLDESDAAAIVALSRVLRTAAVHLQAQFAVVGRVDHTYVSGAARAALSDAGLPTDLALRTGLSLRHILVDEFQDTSLAQFDLIEALTAGWEERDGRTLFVVGDPMQSIYQFREAEVGLFLRARDHGIGEIRLEPLQLTRNFRSTPPLIDWINEAFMRLFPASDDLRASAVSFTPSVAGTGSGTESDIAQARQPVQVRLFESGDRTAETAFVTAEILAIRARAPAATVAVLVASRSHAAPIVTALEALNVDAVGVDLVPLREVSIVRDLVALTRAQSHLGDRTAWLAVLRAPWCGASLATLTALSGRRDPLLLWEAMQSDDRLAGCTQEDRGRVVRVRTVLDAAMSARNSVPLAEWLEVTWARLGAADAYPQNELRHARAFFAALSERVASGEWSGPQELDSLLRDLYAQSQASTPNPVQLMTIHRAKGLEFDHVFVPSLDRALNKGREPLLRWLDLPRAEGESDLVMAPVPTIGDEAGGEVSAYLKKLTAKRAANERLRLLYVAATRARQNLVLSAAPKPGKSKAEAGFTPRSGTLLACLWPAVESAVQTDAAATDAAAAPFAKDDATLTALASARDAAASGSVPAGAGAPASSMSVAPTPTAGAGVPMLRRLVAGWTLPAVAAIGQLPKLPLSHQSLEPPEFSWVGETARHIGTVVHAALEHFASLPELPAESAIEADRAAYLRQLQRHGVPERDLPRAAAIVVEALTRTVSNPKGQWIFATEHRDARSEWALTGIAQGRLTNVVIDRSFVDRDGTRWVIDFKTSRHEGGGLEEFLHQEVLRYRPQLETYVALARGVASEPVRAGLYFPLLDRFRELV